MYGVPLGTSPLRKEGQTVALLHSFSKILIQTILSQTDSQMVISSAFCKFLMVF